MSFQKSAIEYCKIRITSTLICLVIIALILFYIAFNLEKWMGDTSYYQPIVGIYESGEVKSSYQNNKTYYYVDFNVVYNVNDKKYYAIRKSSNFNTSVLAEQHLESMKNKSITLYFDPNNPSNSTDVINKENYISVILVIIAILMVCSGVFAFIYRESPSFCGIQFINDVPRFKIKYS